MKRSDDFDPWSLRQNNNANRPASGLLNKRFQNIILLRKIGKLISGIFGLVLKRDNWELFIVPADGV